MNIGIILLIIVVVLVLAVVGIFNNLVTWRNRADRAFADLQAAYQKRFDTVPNLVDSVKAFMKQEKGVLTAVTEARANVAKAGDPGKVDEAQNQLSGALKTLFAVAENYPELKSNENVSQLMSELVDLEDKIFASRRFYNTSVMEYNTKLETFPGNVFANMFNFQKKESFVAQDKEAEKAVKVDFNDK
jgi:LemA protein